MDKEKQVKAESFQDLAEIIMEMNINMEKKLMELNNTMIRSILTSKKISKDLADYKVTNDKRVAKLEKDVACVKKILQLDD